MTSELPDIKTELKKQLQYHLEQTGLIQKAHNAIDPTAPVTTATITQDGVRRRIPWTKKITKILSLKENREQEFSPQDIKEMLISEGYTELESLSHKNTIYTTMKRMVDNGVLEKVATGLYKFKPRVIRRRPIQSGLNTESYNK